MRETTRTTRLVINGEDNSKGAFASANSSLASLGSGSAMVATALGTVGIAAAAALGVITAKAMMDVDALAKQADALGLSTEALGAYRLAGELAGVSNEQLGTSIKQMNTLVAQAAEGSGRAAKALDKLGLDARQLREDGPEKSFEAIISKLEQVENPMDRTRAAMEIFGKSGAEMVNLTSEALVAAREDMDGFGASISRVDAAKIEAANDSLARAKKGLAVVGQAVAIEVSPYISHFADLLVDLVIKSGWLQRTAVAAFEAIATGGIKAFAGITAGSAIVFQSLRYGFWEVTLFVQRGIEELIRWVEWAIEKINIRGMFDQALEGIRQVRAEEGLRTQQYAANRDAALAAGAEALGMYDELVGRAQAYRQQITATAQAQAEATAAAKQARGALVIPLDDPAGDKDRLAQERAAREEARQLRQQQDALERLRFGLLAEEEQLRVSKERRLEELDTFYQAGLLTGEAEFFALEAALHQQQADKLAAINKKRLDKELEDQRRQQAEKDQIEALAWGNYAVLQQGLYTVAEGSSKKMMKLFAASAVPVALANAFKAASGAMADTPGPWWVRAGAYAAALGQGLSAYAAIKGVLGSGGGGAGYGAGTPASPVITGPEVQERAETTVILRTEVHGILDERLVETTLVPLLNSAGSRNVRIVYQ